MNTFKLASILFLFGSTAGAKTKIELRLEHKPVIQNNDINEAIISQSQDAPANWTISLKVKPNASKRFSRLTKKNTGKKLEIVLNENALASPIIQAKIASGKILLSQKLTEQAAKEIANDLNLRR